MNHYALAPETDTILTRRHVEAAEGGQGLSAAEATLLWVRTEHPALLDTTLVYVREVFAEATNLCADLFFLFYGPDGTLGIDADLAQVITNGFRWGYDAAVTAEILDERLG